MRPESICMIPKPKNSQPSEGTVILHAQRSTGSRNQLWRYLRVPPGTVIVCSSLTISIRHQYHRWVLHITTQAETDVQTPQKVFQRSHFSPGQRTTSQGGCNTAEIGSPGLRSIGSSAVSPKFRTLRFLLVPTSQYHLKGTRFGSISAVIQTVQVQPETFYLKGLTELQEQSQRCVSLNLEYVE